MSSLSSEVVRSHLNQLEAAREKLVNIGRELSWLARRVISSTLRRNHGEAGQAVYELEKVFRYLVESFSRYPELYYSNLFHSIVAEYVEAEQLYSMAFSGRLKSIVELGVHPVPYILGSADLIGELKRMSLEFLRKEEYEESFRYFEIAERVFEELSELGFADTVVPGLRRKLDIYRKVVDEWRVLLVDIESRMKLERVCRQATKLAEPEP